MDWVVRVTFFFVLCAVLAGALALAAPPAGNPAHALYDALNSLRVNSGEVYNVKDLDLRRDAIHLTFTQGKFAFFQPFQGKITGAVFSGRGHILMIPRDTTEKASLVHFLGAPILDQNFSKIYMRFDDDSATLLQSRIKEADFPSGPDPSFSEEWDPAVATLNAGHSLRLLSDLLADRIVPYFYAGILGETSGPFDALVDDRHEEQVQVGQPKTVNDQQVYDVWASFHWQGPDDGRAPFVPESYSIDTTIGPELDSAGAATITLRAVRGGERAIPLELSSDLRVDSASDESGQSLEFFQSELSPRHELSARGDNALTVILTRPVQAGDSFRVRLTYKGHVIHDSGYGVYYAGEHGTWYPHVGAVDSFAHFDLRFRWPRKLVLVATGNKIDEHEDGDWRQAHWISEKPIFAAGFNLGEYRTVSVESTGIKVDLFANPQLELAVQRHMGRHVVATPFPKADIQGNVKPVFVGSTTETDPAPDPATILRRLGEEIAQAAQYFSRYGGPFPYDRLEVSQVPGTTGEGWPGLLYLPEFSFLSSETQRRVGLSTARQEHFTEIVPYHELAHQWWGNQVAWHSYRDQWITEGIANYVALLFAETRKDSNHALKVWLNRYRDSLSSRIPGNPDSAEDSVDSTGPLALGYRLRSSMNLVGYEQVVYAKATWVVHMLRMMLRDPQAKDPDERFARLLRSLIESHRGGALTTDDLEHAVQKIMLPSMDLEGGRSMSWFFDQWVRGTGIPHYKVEFTAKRSGEQFVVKGVLNQDGVPPEFLARVPLFATAGGKPVFLGHVTTTGSQTSFRFVTSFDLKRILIDPELTLLCVAD